MNAGDRRRRALTALVFLVAAVTLVESWFACVAAAETGGRPMPWLWPTTLEAFAVALILVAWDSLSDGRPARLVRLLLFVTTSVMVAVQVLDAPATALGWLTAGWTPLGLNLMVEVAVRLRYDAERRTVEAARVAAEAAERDAEREAERLASVARDVTGSATEASQDGAPRETLTPVPDVTPASRLTSRQRDAIEARHAKGMTGAAIIKETGYPHAAVRAYLQELRKPSDAAVAGNGGVAR